MRKAITKISKLITSMLIITILPMIYSITISNADSKLEDEFLNFISKYNIEDIVVEPGISLRRNETLDLSKYPGWSLSNDNTVTINKNQILKPQSEGTVYISNKIGEKIYIVEIHVTNEIKKISNLSNIENKDRNYYKVFIDAGHGGSDPGNVTSGYKESNINLNISKLVQEKLNSSNLNIEIMMSRTNDKFISLSERSELANKYGADVFVSIHNNAISGNTSVQGIETFYHTNKIKHKPLSMEIQNNAVELTGAKYRRVDGANYAVLRETNMVSSLFEGGFMTNKDELNKLINPSYQDKLATAISTAIETYLLENISINKDVEELPIIARGIVTANNLNVRSGYGTNYDVIGQIKKSSEVDIVENLDGWYKIKFNNHYGYVSGTYIDIIDNNKEIGWKLIDGKWYYLEQSGEMAKGWRLIDGKWYYLEESGEMAKGWKLIDGKWYYLEQSGEMAKGWKLIDEKWYYLEESGEMAKGWKLIDGKWYYLEQSGEMAKGWKLIDEKWYYLEESGEMAKGWKLIDGKWYYLEQSGEMAVNTIIDGWKIDLNGVASKIS